MSLHTHAKRHEQVDEFLGRPSTNAQDTISLDRFLGYGQERSNPSSAVPVEELEERLELVREAQNRTFGVLRGVATDDKVKERQFTAFQLSVMMMMPLQKLKGLNTTLATFDQFERLVAVCMYLPVIYGNVPVTKTLISSPAYAP